MERDHELEIARGIRRAYQRRLLLLVDFTAFIVYCAWLGASWSIDPFFRQVGMLWMVAVGLHTLGLIYAEWLDFAVRRAVEKEQFAYYRSIAETALGTLTDEKPKRDPYFTLMDDAVSEAAVERDAHHYQRRH